MSLLISFTNKNNYAVEYVTISNGNIDAEIAAMIDNNFRIGTLDQKVEMWLKGYNSKYTLEDINWIVEKLEETIPMIQFFLKVRPMDKFCYQLHVTDYDDRWMETF